MTKVLLTGGTGFIARHILAILLEQGHKVTTTVRSQEKAETIKKYHPDAKLDFKIVEDIAAEGAFNEAVKVEGLEAVIHTASPFHFNVTDTQKDLLDPAVNGTNGVLAAIKKNAPSVKKVVITSSFAAIVDGPKGNRPGYTYSEKDWNPITAEEATQNPSDGYRASKTFAEKAAWDFVEKEKPNFTLTTINPPLVLGPILPPVPAASSLNTSNQRVLAIASGAAKSSGSIPETGTFLWIDVRDLALAHVKALADGDGKRFFATAGYFSNREIRDIIAKKFPGLKDKVPGEDAKGGEYPKEGVYKFDNERTRALLDKEFISLEKSVTDLVRSLGIEGA
ncbi:putative NADPH-dependent methylglyoxal reductase GRP2 [Calycina marina]|uniref:NADPH-dependent methylglyoxal reductase GRP2 n=1 Tax=Calycina marina TaxID=1763456 RepID=A0A9P7Z275_9HELO|nr:putative NADPH-dependent methylglyoxal reductase GRP2 [Calycina marina]